MKKALVIGISGYNDKYSNLPGCINDMTEWSNLLKDVYGYEIENTRLLTNERATKSNILTRLDWLFSGDRLSEVVLFFAGHGAQIRRRDYETGDLHDGLDEALVCYPKPHEDIQDHLIFDDDIYSIVKSKNLPASCQITFVFDSCHAGGMAKSIFITEDKYLTRSIVLPLDIEARSVLEMPITRVGELKKDNSLKHVIVGAAKEIESAWDARMEDGKRHGAFSYYATRFLTQNPSSSYTELKNAVTEKVTERFPQHPQLLGNNGRFDNAFLN